MTAQPYRREVLTTAPTLDRIKAVVDRLRKEAESADPRQLLLLVDELDVLAEQLVGRHDQRSVDEKASLQLLIRTLRPARLGDPPAATQER